jgi:hypothetical protein
LIWQKLPTGSIGTTRGAFCNIPCNGQCGSPRPGASPWHLTWYFTLPIPCGELVSQAIAGSMTSARLGKDREALLCRTERPSVGSGCSDFYYCGRSEEVLVSERLQGRSVTLKPDSVSLTEHPILRKRRSEVFISHDVRVSRLRPQVCSSRDP